MNTQKNKSRKFVAWMLVLLLLVSMVPTFAFASAPVFGWSIFNNGPGGTQYPRPNASLAQAGLIRMWAQFDGAGSSVYLAAADTIVARDQDDNCAMQFVRVGRMWIDGQGWANYFNSVDVNKNGDWQYINLSITVHGQTVSVLLANALFEAIAPPVFSWDIFNNGPGGTQYPNPNWSLEEAGLIRLRPQLDGADAHIYHGAAGTIVALDQDENCAMEFIHVHRIWSDSDGWLNYFMAIDANKNGNWQYIDLSITVHGQTVHALLANAWFQAPVKDITVTFVVEAGPVGVYAQTTTTVTVPVGQPIPTDAIPNTVARAGFYFVGWYPSNPAELDAITQDITFTARFNPLFHYVTFEAGSGGSIAPTSFGLVMRIRDGFTFWADRVPTPVANEGYTFTGWYPSNPANFIVREDMTFTAVFTADTQPPPPDVYDFIFLLFDDFAIDRILAPTMNVPDFTGGMNFTETNPDTITGMYYDVFNRFGRVSRQANIGGRPAWQSLFGWAANDGTWCPKLEMGVHRGMYETRIVAAVGKTVDNTVFRTNGNPERAENELYIEFGVRTFYRADIIEAGGPIGNARAASVLGYNGTSAQNRAVFAGFNLRYSDENFGVLEAWIIENGVERAAPLLGTTAVFGLENSDVWFDINIYAKMATSATASDGILRIYVDGVLEIEATNLNWFDPVFGFNDVGLYAATNCMNGPALGQATRWYGPLKVARIPNAVTTDPNETRLTRFFMESGRRQQQLSDSRTHYDITMEPGTPEFVVSLWPMADNAEVWVNGTQYGHGQPIRFDLTAITPRPAFADASTGNRSWGIVDHAGIFEIDIVPGGGVMFAQTYTFSVEMLMPYTVVEEPRPEWLWWDDFSDWGRTQGSYAGRGNPVASNTTAFFYATPGTGLGGGSSLEARFDRSIIGGYGAFSAPDVSFQFNDPWGTNIQQRPDGLPLPQGRQIDYEAAGFPAGTNALIDQRGDIDDMFVRFYLRMDKDWGNYLLWDDPSFWGPGRPGGAAGNNGQNFIGQGSGGGHDKLMRFMGRTHGTNYTQPGPYSGQPALGPQTVASGATVAPSNGHMAQTFILHSWTMGGSHPHHFLGLDPTSGVDILTTNHGSQRLWQQQWPGTPVADRLPGAAFRAWDRADWFNTAYAAWNFKRAELRAQFDAINVVNSLPFDQRPAGAMPGFAAPGSGHVVITERQNDFNYLNWLGASTSGGQFPNIPIFDSDHVGEWYLVEQRVRLNTPGQSDGIMQLWIDEKLVVERTDINFRGWNIEAGITRIQLEVYANSPRGATVDASRYISHLVVSTEYVGPAVFVPSSPLDDARRELRTILRAEIGQDFANPVFVLDGNAFTAETWDTYVDAINAAIVVYNTSDDILAIRAAGQLVLSTKAALVAREVILVELNPTPDWLFWQDFDGNTGGAGSLQVQGLGYIADGAGIGGSRALQSTMQPGDTARISFPAQDVAYIRFYTRANVSGVGGGAFWARAYHNQNWGANAIRLNVNGNGSIEINAGAILPGTTGVLSSTEWVGLELRFDMVERTVTTWVDGRLQGTVDIPAAITAEQFASFQFHNFTGYGGGTRYYDNFVVSTSYIGPMQRVFADGGGEVTDKAALTAAITAQIGADRDNWVFVLNYEDYTTDSWAAYVAAIEAAIAVEANANATQIQIDNATSGITAARNALVLIPTTGPRPIEHPQPEWLHWDDFETDKAGTVVMGARAARLDGIGMGGTRALRLDYGGAPNAITDALRVTFPAQTEVYFRYYVRMGANWPVGTSLGVILRLNQFHQQASIGVQGNGTLRRNWDMLPRVPDVPDATALSLAPTAANIGRWIPIEVRMVTTGGAGGTIQVWIDDVLSFSNTNIAINVPSFTSFDIVIFPETDTIPAGTHLYVDNLVISTAPIGLVCWEGCDCEKCDVAPDPREDWLFWNNFDGDNGGTALSLGGAGEIGAFGVTGQGLRNAITENTTPLTIQFPAQEVVYVRFDVRSEVSGVENDSFWARVHNGQYWGANSFRLNVWANGSISSMGRPIVANTAGALTSDQWVGIEMRFDIPAGQKTIWINGELAGVGDLQPDRAITEISRFQLHTFDRAGTGYRFYDNFVVSTSRIGVVDWE